MTTTTKKAYVVVNPRGIPQGVPIFGQGDKQWFEGEAYDGANPAEPLRRGFLQEVKDGKE